ncbi:hypothetical protein FQN49_007655 [Arthroderma sp. PD_2]|nr:hypothetical protein FQN49_007655 [Arthroderma sp. PD_2]
MDEFKGKFTKVREQVETLRGQLDEGAMGSGEDYTQLFKDITQLSQDISHLEGDENTEPFRQEVSQLNMEMLELTNDMRNVKAHQNLKIWEKKMQELALLQSLLKDRNTGDKSSTVKTEASHGGNIAVDVKIIKKGIELDSEFAQEYAQTFHEAYGVSLVEASAKVDVYPPQAIRTFNVLASTRDVDMWYLPELQLDRRRVRDLALHIIEAVSGAGVDAGRLAALFEEGGRCHGEFSEMDEVFRRHN